MQVSRLDLHKFLKTVKVISLADVEPYVKKALEDGTGMVSTGVKRGQGGAIVGEGFEVVTQVDGYDIWVTIFKDNTGRIIVNNAGVR